MGVIKFGRNYSLQVQATDGSTLIFAPPFTVEFDTIRSDLSSANTAKIRLYNISKDHRNQIRRDSWDGSTLRKVILQAGYGSILPTILNGSITQAWSVREGVNFITEIQSFDGGFAYVNAKCPPFSVQAGTPYRDIIVNLIASLKPFGISMGSIGNYPQITGRARAFDGNTIDILKELTGNGFFIDNGIAHCLGNSECIEADIPTVSAATGLLGTPVREVTKLHFDILFEPNLFIGQQIKINSSTGDGDTNKFWKIVSIHHKGVISDAVSGEAVTSIGVNSGSFTPIPRGL